MLVSVVLMNVLVHQVVCRWDMTDDKRYTISQPTKELLKELDSELLVTVLLGVRPGLLCNAAMTLLVAFGMGPMVGVVAKKIEPFFN